MSYGKEIYENKNQVINQIINNLPDNSNYADALSVIEIVTQHHSGDPDDPVLKEFLTDVVDEIRRDPAIGKKHKNLIKSVSSQKSYKGESAVDAAMKIMRASTGPALFYEGDERDNLDRSVSNSVRNYIHDKIESSINPALENDPNLAGGSQLSLPNRRQTGNFTREQVQRARGINPLKPGGY